MLEKEINTNGQFEPTAPGYKFIKSQRNIGYKPRTALGDLVDNSIDAQSKNIWIDTCIESSQISKIIIVDDGDGMDFETLYGSFKLGFERKRTQTQLGKFGVGGTVGSLSMAAEKLTVTRSASGIFARKYDLEVIKEENQWGSAAVRVEPEMIEKLDRYIGEGNTGTMIILSNLDKLGNKRKANFETSIVNHFSQIYCQHIASNDIKIKVHDKTVGSKDPIFWFHSDVVVLTDTFIPGTKMKLRVVSVKNIITNDGGVTKQGGYIFRCNRLIESKIVNNESWSTLWAYHPNQRDCRWALYYDADMDDIMNTSSQKDTVNPSQSIKDKIGRIVMAEARPLAKKRNLQNTKVTDVEKKESLERLSKTLSTLPKKVEFEASPAIKEKGAQVIHLDKKVRESYVPPSTYVIKEDKIGSGSEFAIIDENPNQDESKFLIRLNLEHPYMVKHYNNNTAPQRQAVSVWTTAFLMTLLSQPESEFFDLDDMKREFSSKLNQITRKLDQ